MSDFLSLVLAAFFGGYGLGVKIERWVQKKSQAIPAECSRVHQHTRKEHTVPETAPNDQPNNAIGNELP